MFLIALFATLSFGTTEVPGNFTNTLKILREKLLENNLTLTLEHSNIDKCKSFEVYIHQNPNDLNSIFEDKANDDFIDLDNVYFDGEMIKKNVVKMKYEDASNSTIRYSKSVKISDVLPLIESVSEDDENFLLIRLQDIFNLKTNEVPSSEELKCKAVQEFHDSGLLGLFGYGAKAIKDEDIYPSITYLIKNYPKSIKVTEIPKGQSSEGMKQDFSKSCSQDSLLPATYSLHKAGIAGSLCVPNNKIPNKVKKCSDGSDIQKHLQGFKIGQFWGDLRTLKSVLIRFGPVLFHSNTFGHVIVFGWLGGQPDSIIAWTKIKDQSGKCQIGTILLEEGYYSGNVLVNSVASVRAAWSYVKVALLLPAIALFL